MKKFAFSLQSVFGYKQTLEKTQKADLSRAEAELRALMDQDRLLDEAFERNNAEREAALCGRLGVVGELEKYDVYFRRIREEKEELAIRILKAEQVRTRCQELLIVTMKEIKTYTKLKDEQYKQYLKEVADEEEKEMSDRVSFTSVSQAEN